ncbi:PHA/PHB synthase family protein [Nocardia asteroides]|uniref:PHA/PHB synthase family protein n=1 Tax=Nocardia asteroides TaxID=1824 RepID=UPI0037872EE2
MTESFVSAPLDLLLTQATVGTARGFLPGRSGLHLLAAMASRPRRVAHRAASLAAEVTRIVAGTSEVAPSSRDKRFADPAWTGNPALRRIVQIYLAAGTAAEGLVQDLPLDRRDAQRIQFLTANLIEALAPSNSPVLSPVAWKAFIDTGGGSAISGIRQLVDDLSGEPYIPSMVDQSAFRVGVDLGVTPGAVVLRTPMFELIHYRPQTETVREAPLLVVPPTINKFYVLDLAPGRSLIEFLVRQGQQVFLVSWRNPDARHSKWGFDAYTAALSDAFGAVDEITGHGATHVLAACSGGLLAAMAAARGAAAGHDRLASLSLLVTMIDQARDDAFGAMIDEQTAAAATAKSRRMGYLDGKQLARVFAWLRPGDLVWNYWVNNYLQGRTPPAFDILFWNADTTRMTAKLHHEFIDAAIGNKLAKPGGVTVGGTEIDLKTVTVDSYVVAGSADHICPWENCYRSSRLLGGKVRFVLSTNGHIAALVNPPGNRKSSYRVGDDTSLDPAEWQRTAITEEGSWWPDYARWLADRSGALKPAPTALGSVEHRPLESAPGSYVLDK